MPIHNFTKGFLEVFLFKVILYIVAYQAHPALVNPHTTRQKNSHFYLLWGPQGPQKPKCVPLPSKGLTDRVLSWLGGLAILWRPRPSGTLQYIVSNSTSSLIYPYWF